MIERGCTVRVPDNCDFVSCGDTVLRSNRCAEHLHEEVENLQHEIEAYEAKIAKCRVRIAELNTESG